MDNVRQLFGPEVLCLLLVDMFHENTFVLEHITLRLKV